MLDSRERHLHVLSKLKGVGNKTVLASRQHALIGRVPIAESGVIHERIRKALAEPGALDRAQDQSDADVAAAEAHGATILPVGRASYPTSLAASADPAAFLYVRGSVDALAMPAVAIIGTREPTDHGRVITRRLASLFVERGWAVVSGLATGCDTIAHEATLDSGGVTVAVMAHGLQTVAPKSNSALAARILANGGALVSIYAFGVEPRPQFFADRDKYQAALTQGVVMVQSDVVGGSMHASRAALKYGRHLIVPYPTAKDVANHEPKIQANLAFAQDRVRAAELLNCGPGALARGLMILRSNEQYDEMFERLTRRPDRLL